LKFSLNLLFDFKIEFYNQFTNYYFKLQLFLINLKLKIQEIET
jgi:hypothetical protein